MRYGAVSVHGWKFRKLAKISMYQCPECGHCQENIYGGGDGKYECFHCNKQFAENEFREATRERTVVTCAKCGREVTLLPSTFDIAGLGFICSQCHNYVAVLYGTHFVNPSTVLTAKWNPTVYRRAEPITSAASFLVCRTMKDFLVLKVLQAIVKEEDARFLFGRPKEHRAGLLLDLRRRKYLGFLVWTESEYATLGASAWVIKTVVTHKLTTGGLRAVLSAISDLLATGCLQFAGGVGCRNKGKCLGSGNFRTYRTSQ